MGFAPTWLRQVSPLLHKTTLTSVNSEHLLLWCYFFKVVVLTVDASYHYHCALAYLFQVTLDHISL